MIILYAMDCFGLKVRCAMLEVEKEAEAVDDNGLTCRLQILQRNRWCMESE